MSNRTTVKSNIVTKCVPTVSNADMIDMLNAEMNDNLKFLEDVASAQAAATNNITVDFTGKDRVDLTRTGGILNITVSGIGDGEVKYLKIIKTSAQNITWVGVTDVTPCKPTAMLASTILYEIVRKGSNYWCRAFIESVAQASDNYLGVSSPASAAENNALLNLSKYVTPGRLPNARTTQTGIVRISTQSETDAGTDVDGGGKQLVVQPSELLRKLTTKNNWINFTVPTGVSGSGFWAQSVERAQYYIDNVGNVHVIVKNLSPNHNNNGNIPEHIIVGALPLSANVSDQIMIMATIASQGSTGDSTKFKRWIIAYINGTDLVMSNQSIDIVHASGLDITIKGYLSSDEISFYVVYRPD